MLYSPGNARLGAMMAELARRIAFTLGVLLLYRLGSNIPLPGIDLEIWSQAVRGDSGNVRSLLFTGAYHRLTIFALNLTPYITAAIVVQLATIVCRPLRALNRRGERGRQVIRKITLALTALLAAAQAYGLAQGIDGVQNGSMVVIPSSLFLASAVATMTGGVLLLAWLSEQITSRGIGNGIALILLAGTVSALREPIFEIRALSIQSLVSDKIVLSLWIMVIAVTGLVVLIERARRHFEINYPARRIGDRVLDAVSANLSVKLNSAGLIPAILASWLLWVLGAAANVLGLLGAPALAHSAALFLAERPVAVTLYTIFIFLGTFLYAAYLFDPEDIAARLQQSGASIAGVEPGESTALYIDYVLSRITLIGASYLVLVCLLPTLISIVNVPVYFGGQFLLILVCTVVDLEAQVRGSLAQFRRD